MSADPVLEALEACARPEGEEGGVAPPAPRGLFIVERPTRVPKQGAGPAGALRALVVAETATVRALCCALLAAAGIVAEPVVDLALALERLRQGPYDVLVFHLEWPTTEGLSLVQRVRGQPGLQGLPVLLLVADEMTAVRDAAHAAGADALLEWPGCGEPLGEGSVLVQVLREAAARRRGGA